jgi:hypothetical protein
VRPWEGSRRRIPAATHLVPVVSFAITIIKTPNLQQMRFSGMIVMCFVMYPRDNNHRQGERSVLPI